MATQAARRKARSDGKRATGGARARRAAELLQGELQPDGKLTARAAGLRYVTDTSPGIRRRRAGRAFSYVGPDGERIHDAGELRRIRALAIPPAWTDVWICPSPNGHIQATGRDARGRKQYRYHSRWHEVRDLTKYDRMLVFAEALPGIRERVAQDLGLSGLPREKVLATVVSLLERTLIRVGNDEYAKQNQSYGLTTLQNDHADVSGSTVGFHFRGKSGKEWDVRIRDRRLARVVRRCQDLPGEELFQYLDESGEPHTISSGDVNDYLREISGQEFTAKDFRTWEGTVLAFLALVECGPCDGMTHAKKNVTQVVKSVAERLGNTAAVCRKSYIHPSVLDAYLAGDLCRALDALAQAGPAPAIAGLDTDEAQVVAFLTQLKATSEK